MVASTRSAGAFEPILVEQRRKSGMTKLGLPQNTKERRHRLLVLARQTEQHLSVQGTMAIARFGARTKAKIHLRPARRRRELVMSDFV